MSALELVELDGLSRTQWLEARRQGLGGSDAPAIAGLDRFRSPFAVYLDKIGELEPSEETDAMRWGNRLEQPIADEFQDRNGLLVDKPAHLYQSAAHPFMLANPDRTLYSLPALELVGGLEIKTSRLDEDWRDAPPTRVLIQCQHYMAVMEWRRMYIAVLLHGRNYAQWEIDRDDETIELLTGLEATFWQRVLDRDPPPLDGHRATTDALEELYRHARVDSELELPDHARELLVELKAAKQQEADAGEDVAALENALKALLGEHEIGTLDGLPAISWKAPKASGRKHNCPECAHPSDKAPSRRFTLRKAAA